MLADDLKLLREHGAERHTRAIIEAVQETRHPGLSPGTCTDEAGGCRFASS